MAFNIVELTCLHKFLLLVCIIYEVRTATGGEFGWGGTSDKHHLRCPKLFSATTETSRRLKGEKND